MKRERMSAGASSIDLASIVRGLYGRVARQLDLDPSYVSRVARGERRSEIVEVAIEREIHRVLQIVSTTRNGGYTRPTMGDVNGPLRSAVKVQKRPARRAVA